MSAVLTSDETLVIETPERVPLHFPLASIGNRFIACAIDHAIQIVALTVLIIIFAIYAWHHWREPIGKLLVDLRSPASTQAALGGPYPFICLFMNNSYVNSHKAVVQHIVNAYVKTLKWIHTHTAAEIADRVGDWLEGD